MILKLISKIKIKFENINEFFIFIHVDIRKKI